MEDFIAPQIQYNARMDGTTRDNISNPSNHSYSSRLLYNVHHALFVHKSNSFSSTIKTTTEIDANIANIILLNIRAPVPLFIAPKMQNNKKRTKKTNEK